MYLRIIFIKVDFLTPESRKKETVYQKLCKNKIIKNCVEYVVQKSFKNNPNQCQFHHQKFYTCSGLLQIFAEKLSYSKIY